MRGAQAYRRYSEAEEKRIRDGFYAEESDEIIAAALGRAVVSVRDKRLNMSLRRSARIAHRALAEGVVYAPWYNDIDIGHDEMREYAETNKIAPGIDALNEFRRAHRLPEYRLVQRWSK